jgi:multicomponent Na+:H+ antiporter subunit A
MAQASAQVYGEALTVKLALWHGLTTALWLSLAAIGLGVGVYVVYAAAAALVSRLLYPLFNTGYDLLLAGLLTGSARLTRLLQNGRLRYYLVTIFLAAAGLVGAALLTYQDSLFGGRVPELASPRLYEIVLALIIVATAIRITRAAGRLEAIAGLGVIGALISLLFVLYSAPDLALTQLLTETLMVIVFLLVFHFLPQFFEERTLRLGQVRDVLVSLIVGVTAAGLVLLAVVTDLPVGEQSLASFFTATSYAEAHGRNIVNVILVDFRGVDTLGEISVLAIAGTGILALLRNRR